MRINSHLIDDKNRGLNRVKYCLTVVLACNSLKSECFDY